MDAFAISAKVTALKLLQHEFPQRLAELREIITSDARWQVDAAFSSSLESPAIAEPSAAAAKKRKTGRHGASTTPATVADDGDAQSSHPKSTNILFDEHGNAVVYMQHIPLHPVIQHMATRLRCEVNRLCTSSTAIKLWIQLNVPKIEDGNNFGVSIQEEMIADLTRVEDHAYGMLEQIGKYYASRGKLASKVVKYPYLEDYAESVREFDLRMGMSLRLYMIDLQNDYAILYDRLTKNMDRLEKPRGSGNAVASMY
jgi:proteasome activator subunit 2 (PA28 beta)